MPEPSASPENAPADEFAVLVPRKATEGTARVLADRRSETQSQRLGIDQSILGLSTRDYLLRSIGPVLVLLIGVSAFKSRELS